MNTIQKLNKFSGIVYRSSYASKQVALVLLIALIFTSMSWAQSGNNLSVDVDCVVEQGFGGTGVTCFGFASGGTGNYQFSWGYEGQHINQLVNHDNPALPWDTLLTVINCVGPGIATLVVRDGHDIEVASSDPIDCSNPFPGGF